jgi:murein DD-endopeptidase MepM/ murein hydrolase activator NlpD
MKRNKLIRPSETNRFLTPKKKRPLKKLSFLALGGICLTSIVLATSKPVEKGLDAQVIDLPGLPAANQNISQNIFTLPTKVETLENTSDTGKTNEPEFSEVDQPEEDLALLEQNQIDQIIGKQTVELESATTPSIIDSVSLDWHEEKVKSGDNLTKLFSRVGLSAKDVYQVTQSDGNIKPLLNLKPGQKIRFGLTKDIDEKTELHQLELAISEIETLIVKVNDSGFSAETELREIQIKENTAIGHIESSLFEAGLLAGLSDELIMELAYIFGWDIDFALDLRQGDSFKLVYHEHFIDGKKFEDGEILAAEFTNKGNTFRAIRFTDDKGDSHYFSPNGESMRKAFNRSPVHFSRISSRFNPNRLHPVLKTSRPHRGVDYAAATGTPIMATGDGKVSFIGTKGGYGRTVVLSHGGKYTTLYAHMSRFKKGLKSGQRVKQGQIIGYIGSSGLATGPHLHYEFRVNGVHRNPLTVALPHAKPLANQYMSKFKSQASPLLAQLDNLNDTQFVSLD